MPAFSRSAKPAAPTNATPPPPPPPPPAASSSKASPSDLTSSATNLTQQSLSVLHQFLCYADPESASLLPLSSTSNHVVPSSSIPSAPTDSEIPIPEWTVLYTTTTPPTVPGGFSSSITVRSHPDPNRYLFSVQSTLPGVTARQFWSLMASAENRKLWDSTVEEGAVKRWLSSEARQSSSAGDEGEASAEMARAVAARVELLRFGSIFMVAKARDMVLLSVDARLPSNPSSTGGGSDHGPLRLVSTSQSIVDPSLPPRKGYTRFELRTGGFMVEDLGDDDVPDAPTLSPSELGKSPSSATSTKGSHIRKGLLALGRRGRSNSSSSSASRHPRQASDSLEPHSTPARTPIRDPRGPAVRITQVSDLGEMAAWVPASVIKMVASTLVPRSIASVAKVAKMMPVAQALYCDYDQQGGVAEGESTAEKLGENGGTWYRHRTLPEMVGSGMLRKPRPAAPIAKTPAEATTTPESIAPGSLSDVPEVASGTEAKVETVTLPAALLKDTTNTHQNTIPPAQDTQDDLVIAATSTASAPKSPLPPRTSSLPPSSPSLDRHLPSFPGSPNKPLSPSSPLSNRPAMLLDLASLAPPTLFPSRTSARTPSSPGLFASTDSDLGGSVSSLTPSSPAARMCKRFNIPMTPSEGTETVPGSVAASEFEGADDYLSYGILEKQFKRATLNLAPQDRESQEVLEDAEDGEVGDTTLKFPFPASPAAASGMGGLTMSPAEKRSRLLSSEYFTTHVDAPGVGGGKNRADTRSDDARGKAESNKPQAGVEMDRKTRRLSSALFAEMERRQASASGFSPRSNNSRPISPQSPHSPHSTMPLPRLPNIHLEQPQQQEAATIPASQSSDLVALLADALSESLPYIPTTGEREVREQVRRVSAMLLAGSDALALSLAPGARDSLGLQLDGLSTPTEEGSEVDTPRSSFSGEVEKVTQGVKGKGKGKARYGEGLGTAGYRSRKVSVNSMGRSISVSAPKADAVAITESVVSIRRNAGSTCSTAPTPASSAASSSHLTHHSTADTSFADLLPPPPPPPPPPPCASQPHKRGEGKAVETLRELERGSRRSVRAVKRNLVTSAPPATAIPRYGARLLSGLAYYSGYSWYYSASSSGDVSFDPTQRVSLVGAGMGGRVRPVSTRSNAASRIPSHHSIGRKRTRANYRLENNAKLHPFPGSLGKRAAVGVGVGVGGKAPHNTTAGERGLPPPITGFGVGRMKRYASDAEQRNNSEGASSAISLVAAGAGVQAVRLEESQAAEDESWEDDSPVTPARAQLHTPINVTSSTSNTAV